MALRQLMEYFGAKRKVHENTTSLPKKKSYLEFNRRYCPEAAGFVFSCFYCGEAGKIRDFMTTGTDPEDGISVPMSMKSKSLSAMPSIEITGF